jgi:uncharacterized phage protein (TIGR02220 family)
MPILYRVKGWNEHFENNRSRERDSLSWVPVPNKHDGMTFLRIMAEPDGIAIYGFWMLVLQMLSKQRLPRDGWLTRDGQPTGTPWQASDLALPLRRPVAEIQRALDFLSSGDIDWLEAHPTPITSVAQVRTLVPPTCPPPAECLPEQSAPACGKVTPSGKEGIEENGIEGRECPPAAAPLSPQPTLVEVPKDETRYSRKRTRELAKFILEHLNIKAGREFRDTTENLDLIASRLEEVHLDTAGVTAMVNRQVALWKGDTKMEQYLRPSTLFRKSNFATYYDDRNQPAVRSANPTEPDHEKGF